MKVICLSGKAQSGKDFASKILITRMEDAGANVLTIHFADLLKYICKNYFGWDGVKNENGRKMLQYVGTEVVRAKNPDFWVDFVITLLKFFPDKWNYVVVPDCRFPNEIERFKEENIKVVSIRIERPYYIAGEGMDEEAKLHSSETAIDEYTFDYEMINYGDIRFVKDMDKLAEELLIDFDSREIQADRKGVGAKCK